MKQVKKKISCILAIGMLLSVIPASAETEGSFPQISLNANDLVVNSTNTGFVNLPSSFAFGNLTNTGNTQGNMRAYKITDAFGLTEGDSAIEFVAREQRENNPQLLLSNISFKTDSDFYITQDIYIGEMRDEDVLQFGGRYYDASGTLRDAFIFINGAGDIVDSYARTFGQRLHGGAYQPNNWYRMTMAVTNKDVKFYLDDIVAHQRIKAGTTDTLQARPNIPIACDLPDVGSDFALNFFGARIRSHSGVTDWSGLPQSFAVKEMKIVEGTYDPTKTDTSVTSSVYTVQDLSVYFVGGDVTAISSVSGVAENTTVADFLDKITVPTGALKKVIKINDDDKATTVIGNDATVTSDMKLMVTAFDGAKKFYDISATMSQDLLPSISSSLARYKIDENAMTITMPNATVEKVKSVVTGGEDTTVKIVDANDNEVTTGSVYAGMKLVASKNGVEKVYNLTISTTKVFDTSNALTGIADNTLLHKVTNTGQKTWTVDSTISSYLKGFDNGNYKSSYSGMITQSYPGGTYEVYKATMPTTNTAAYKFTYTANASGMYPTWRAHKSGDMKDTTKADNGDKLIINFKLYMEGTGNVFSVAPYHAGYKTAGVSTSGVGGYDLQSSESGDGYNPGIGDRVTFYDGKVQLGGLIRPSGGTDINLNRSGKIYGKEIGTYLPNTVYDVTIVKSRGTWDDNGTTKSTVITEGVYLNGTNLLTEPVTFQISEKREYFAIREISFFTKGTSYMADMNIYMADDYNPNEPPVADRANLDITTEDLTINASNIFGWDGMTVAQVKAAIDSNINTEVAVLNVSGDAEVADNRAVSLNMLLRVRDKNYKDNVAYYTFTKTNSDTGTLFTVENGKIKATREICIYNAIESENKTMLFAGYTGTDNNTLSVIDTQSHTIDKPNTYLYSIELDYDETKLYEVFMWNLDTLKPFENVKPYVAE